MAKIFVKWLRYMLQGLSILGTASVCCKLLKYLKYGFGVTNGLNIWEMTYIFGKWLKYFRNG